MNARIVDDWSRLLPWWLLLVIVSGLLWWADVQGGVSGLRNPIYRLTGGMFELGFEFRASVEEQFWSWGVDARRDREELASLRGELKGGVVAGAAIARLEEENAALRRLLGAPLDPKWKFLPASVIGRRDDSWWINAGSSDGVEAGMLVVASDLLIGRVEQVDRVRSEVVPLDAPGSLWKVEVRDAESGEVQGEGLMEPASDGLVIRQLLLTEDVYKGDLVVTKGDDGVLPGVPIGQVLSLGTLGDTSLYQHAVVWWPIDRAALSHVAVIYDW